METSSDSVESVSSLSLSQVSNSALTARDLVGHVAPVNRTSHKAQIVHLFQLITINRAQLQLRRQAYCDSQVHSLQ